MFFSAEFGSGELNAESQRHRERKEERYFIAVPLGLCVEKIIFMGYEFRGQAWAIVMKGNPFTRL